MTNNNDLKFFTNTDNDSLYDRFVSTTRDAQFFDILVGYFRTSGFFRMYEELESVEKIRILVGLNVNRKSFELLEEAKNQGNLDFESHKRCREIYTDNLAHEMEVTEDTYEVEVAAKKFIEFIKSGKLELRAHPSHNIHAKVYITRFQADDRDYGRVVTGSSNFSENGLIAQREFNVELKDKADVEYALDRFEALWTEGVDITEEYIDTIRNKTWLNDKITPYQIYLKFLYEYFKEDINADEEIDFALPDGFMDLSYQRQAVLSAKKILDTYDGVFLSDVVGLGKTFITAMLLQQLPPGRKLIICPPVLADYWKETLHQFYVPGFDVESLGKLESLLKKDIDKYTYIVIDEAHRFRNEITSSYENLHRICRNKKVILVSATPLNNKLDDIKTQIKLFQPAKNSTIPGVQNLEAFFRKQQKELDSHEKGSQEYLDAVKRTSERVRDKVLKHIMVRRTRSEIKKYFSEDITQQGLKFPDMGEPQRIIYQFDKETDRVFEQTMELLKEFSYARYTPKLFLKEKLLEFELQSQRNIGGFMKGILVKRLESSFYAFKQSLSRFIISYENFISMYDSGTVWISNKVDVFEFLESDNEDKLISLLEEENAEKFLSDDFKSEYKDNLETDLIILKQIIALWEPINTDPKLEYFTKELLENPILKDQKIIVFSESKETVTYLQENLEKTFPGEVISYSSQGGTYGKDTYSGHALRDIIEANYQPGHKTPKDDVSILLTTDVLAEGINLHRSHIIINYDLPWNPTRVLQRVGRVNRIGTKHDKIYVFNIFPTAQSDAHLGLENNIKAKIQAFHNTLGEDAKYLSDDEELSTHELFGDQLYKKLNDKDSFEDDEDTTDSELRHLKVIRDLRDSNPDLFDQIKNLPKKARSGRKLSSTSIVSTDSLITFFRKGRLKKFVVVDNLAPQELTFLEAASLFECAQETKLYHVPQHYYDLLAQNKEHLKIITSEDLQETSDVRGGASNEAQIIKMLKSSAIRTFKGFTEEEDEYLKQVRSALEAGSIPKNTSKRIKAALKGNFVPLKILAVLKEHIQPDDIYISGKKTESNSVREIILSEFLIEDRA